MTDTTKLIITIDGPGGAGKSTLARALAFRFGYPYLDTGAIYRTVALAAQRASASWCDEGAVWAVTQDIVKRGRLRFLSSSAEVQRVLLDHEDVSNAIRVPEMSAGASTVSAHPKVRLALLALQRNLATSGAVVEGRDTGTIVFPDADVKFFMTASAEQRARRRHDELKGRGIAVSFDETLSALMDRDRRDEERAAAPLKRADDAFDIDTTELTVDEVLVTMVDEVNRRCA